MNERPARVCGGQTSQCDSKARSGDVCVQVYTGSAPPKVGDWIYTPTRMSIDHGEDDIAGGLAQVTEVTYDPRTNGGTHLIRVAQVDRGFYWNNLLLEQVKLAALHGNELARPDPDYTPTSDSGWVSVPGQMRPGEWR